MVKKYRLPLLFVMLLLVIGLTFGNQKEYEYVEHQARSVDNNRIKEEEFLLKEEHGFVVVYLKDGQTVYERTDIQMDCLPERVRREIERGKPMSGIKKLYGFLENYTS